MLKGQMQLHQWAIPAGNFGSLGRSSSNLLFLRNADTGHAIAQNAKCNPSHFPSPHAQRVLPVGVGEEGGGGGHGWKGCMHL